MLWGDIGQWVANVLYAATFGAVIWYAWETRKMRPQMIRPKLVFLTRHGCTGASGLQFRTSTAVGAGATPPFIKDEKA